MLRQLVHRMVSASYRKGKDKLPLSTTD